MNKASKAKKSGIAFIISIFAYIIFTIAMPFLIPNAPAYAAPRNCQAQFVISGKIVQGWTDLGKVRIPKKKNCKKRAREEARHIQHYQIGLSTEQVCKKYGRSGATIYYYTKVEGKKRSKDGSIKSNLGAIC